MIAQCTADFVDRKGAVEPAGAVTQVRSAFGDTPAQIQRPARSEDARERVHRGTNIGKRQVHEHRLANDVAKRACTERIQTRERRRLEPPARKAPPRFVAQTFRGLEAHAGIAVRVEPVDIAAAAATDIGARGAGREETPPQHPDILGRRLREPIVAILRSIAVIGKQGRFIHGNGNSTGIGSSVAGLPTAREALELRMINERAQALLKTLVERYIADGQPVGSRALSRYSGLELSPASIRNVMADLEEMGFISSPHTSAGRVPTSRGYRLFVDTLLKVRPLADVEINQLEGQIDAGSVERIVSSASQLLSDLTHFAGMVSAPRHRSAAFRHLEFLSLGEKRVLVIIVSPEGDVQNRILLTDRPYTPSELNEATNFVNQHYAGLHFDEIRVRIRDELRQLHADMSGLMTAALDIGSQAASNPAENVVIAGERRLLEVEDLSSNMARLRQLFSLFEQKTELLRLLDMSSRATGVQLFIGNESGLVSLDECSVVTAPYEVDGQVVGTVGVIGPTRMAYERVIPIVDITAKLLTSALSHRVRREE